MKAVLARNRWAYAAGAVVCLAAGVLIYLLADPTPAAAKAAGALVVVGDILIGAFIGSGSEEG